MTEAALLEITQTTALALGGVAVAALAVRWFGQEQPQAVTCDQVEAELEQAFPSFAVSAILLDHPGQSAALALDTQSQRIAAVFRIGTRLTSRCVPLNQAKFTVSADKALFHLSDLVTPDVTIGLPPALPGTFYDLFTRTNADNG